MVCVRACAEATVTGRAGRNILRAMVDRKGATTIEYAMIASLIATIIALCYRLFFERMGNFLNTIVF
jgi:Flp pilus assembly pilin Flp